MYVYACIYIYHTLTLAVFICGENTHIYWLTSWRLITTEMCAKCPGTLCTNIQHILANCMETYYYCFFVWGVPCPPSTKLGQTHYVYIYIYTYIHVYIYEDIPIYTHIILILICTYLLFLFFCLGGGGTTARQLGMQDNCRCIVLSPQETWPIIAQGRSQH